MSIIVELLITSYFNIILTERDHTIAFTFCLEEIAVKQEDLMMSRPIFLSAQTFVSCLDI